MQLTAKTVSAVLFFPSKHVVNFQQQSDNSSRILLIESQPSVHTNVHGVSLKVRVTRNATQFNMWLARHRHTF